MGEKRRSLIGWGTQVAFAERCAKQAALAGGGGGGAGDDWGGEQSCAMENTRMTESPTQCTTVGIKSH